MGRKLRGTTQIAQAMPRRLTPLTRETPPFVTAGLQEGLRFGDAQAPLQPGSVLSERAENGSFLSKPFHI